MTAVCAEGVEVEVEDSADVAIAAVFEAFADGEYNHAARLAEVLISAGGGDELKLVAVQARVALGEVRHAHTLIKEWGMDQSEDPRVLSVYGLVLVERGLGGLAEPILRNCIATADAQGEKNIVAHATLNLGLLSLDRAEASSARTHFERALSLARELGAVELQARAVQNIAAVDGLIGLGQGAGLLGEVSSHLSSGDIPAVRKAISQRSSDGRRDEIVSLFATGVLHRSQGSLDSALFSLNRALMLAREGGLVRDTAMTLLEIGSVYLQAGRFAMADMVLEEASGALEGSSFVVMKTAAHLALGRSAVRLGHLSDAQRHLEAASVSSDDVFGGIRYRELQASLWAANGERGKALVSLEATESTYVARHSYADAARVACDRVRLVAAQNMDLTLVRAQAQERFSAISDPRGPIHIAIAMGLGYADTQQFEQAVRAFSDAAKVGRRLGTTAAMQLVAVAEENLALSLRALGHTAAGTGGFKALLERHEQFEEARKAYSDGLTEYERSAFHAAMLAFHQALVMFEKLDEAAFAAQARKSRAWASLRVAAMLAPKEAFAELSALVEEVAGVDDSELLARVQGAQALSAARIPRKNAVTLLKAASRPLREQGVDDVAGLVFMELSLLEEDWDKRVKAADTALALLESGESAAYAMYSLAVDAFNEGDYASALALCDRVVGRSGPLEESVAAVRTAASAAMEE
jgi:tetratricopeptide (TPR) repeat protein